MRYLAIFCIAIICIPVDDVINFEIKKKGQEKDLSILTTRAFPIKQKKAFSHFKGLSLKQTKPTIVQGRNPTLKSKFSIPVT